MIPSDVVTNLLDSDIIVNEFELQLRRYDHSSTDIPEKGMKPLILLCIP